LGLRCTRSRRDFAAVCLSFFPLGSWSVPNLDFASAAYSLSRFLDWISVRALMSKLQVGPILASICYFTRSPVLLVLHAVRICFGFGVFLPLTKSVFGAVSWFCWSLSAMIRSGSGQVAFSICRHHSRAERSRTRYPPQSFYFCAVFERAWVPAEFYRPDSWSALAPCSLFCSMLCFLRQSL
jgi:hypothetical protein